MARPSRTCYPSEDPYVMSLEATYPARPFRLFDLPRELRDNIYDHALLGLATFKLSNKPQPLSNEASDADATPRPDDAVDASADSSPLTPSLIANVKHRASTNIMLVCKTLKQEYQQRASQATTLVLRDNDRFAFQNVMLPAEVAILHHVEVHLILFCHPCPLINHHNDKTCYAVLELHHHGRWMEDLLQQLPKLRSLSVHAYICPDKYKFESKEKLPCERLVQPRFDKLRNISKVEDLTLCKYEFNAYPDLDGPKAMLWEWSAKAEAEKNQKLVKSRRGFARPDADAVTS